MFRSSRSLPVGVRSERIGSVASSRKHEGACIPVGDDAPPRSILGCNIRRFLGARRFSIHCICVLNIQDRSFKSRSNGDSCPGNKLQRFLRLAWRRLSRNNTEYTCWFFPRSRRHHLSRRRAAEASSSRGCFCLVHGNFWRALRIVRSRVIYAWTHGSVPHCRYGLFIFACCRTSIGLISEASRMSLRRSHRSNGNDRNGHCRLFRRGYALCARAKPHVRSKGRRILPR